MPLPQVPRSRDLRGKLLFLGTGTSVGVPVVGCDCPTCRSPNPKNHRTRTSVLLGLPEGTALIDTAPDLRSQLLREGVGLVHAVLFTHAHADHLLGLDDLRVFAYYLGHHVPLYCEPQVQQRIRQMFDYAFDVPPESKASRPRVEFHSLSLEPFSLLGATVLPLRLKHGPLDVLGFRVGRVAYCTDTNFIPEETLARLQDLDVLVLDCLRHRPHPTHFNLEQALQQARRIGARRTLLTHISHELEHETVNAELPPGVELAYDGLCIPLT